MLISSLQTQSPAAYCYNKCRQRSFKEVGICNEYCKCEESWIMIKRICRRGILLRNNYWMKHTRHSCFSSHAVKLSDFLQDCCKEHFQLIWRLDILFCFKLQKLLFLKCQHLLSERKMKLLIRSLRWIGIPVKETTALSKNKKAYWRSGCCSLLAWNMFKQGKLCITK